MSTKRNPNLRTPGRPKQDLLAKCNIRDKGTSKCRANVRSSSDGSGISYHLKREHGYLSEELRQSIKNEWVKDRTRDLSQIAASLAYVVVTPSPEIPKTEELIA